MLDRESETVGRTDSGNDETSPEVLEGAPDRVQAAVTATRDLSGRVERTVEEGKSGVRGGGG